MKPLSFTKGRWILTLSLFAAAGCSGLGHRGLASLESGGTIPSAQGVLDYVSSPAFNSENCVAYLQNLQSQLDSLQPNEVPPAEIVANAPQLTDTLWKIRLALHKRLPEFSPECVTQIRGTFRTLRFIEELITEHQKTLDGMDPANLDFSAQTPPVIQDDMFYLKQLNPDFPQAAGSFEFKNGDVMLARGPSFLSAMISRVADSPSQFSHVILVHVDARTRKTETIESYVGAGTAIYDIIYAMRNENVRLVLLRFKDQDLASKAADFMYATVKGAKKPIPYNYDFQGPPSASHLALTCEQVPQYAFEKASDGKVMLPAYTSTISEDPAFLARMGMAPGSLFTPGDLEVDPRFDLVMEWRDLRLTRDSRVKDAVLTSMVNWIDQYHYELTDTGEADLAGSLIWDVRQTPIWPLFKWIGIPNFDANVPRIVLKSQTDLNQVGTAMLTEMKAEDSASEKKTGWPMTYVNLYQALDDLRERDLAVYQNPKTRGDSLFHAHFHPEPEPLPSPSSTPGK